MHFYAFSCTVDKTSFNVDLKYEKRERKYVKKQCCGAQLNFVNNVTGLATLESDYTHQMVQFPEN